MHKKIILYSFCISVHKLAYSFETGSATDCETELEVSYLNLYIDGKSVMEVDKFNYVCKFGDDEMLETVRQDLGIA